MMMCVQPHNYGRQKLLEFVRSSKNIIDADSEDRNEMNNAALVSTSSEMRNIMKSRRSYSGVRCNGEMNNKTDDIGQFDAIKDNAKKNTRLFSTKLIFLKTNY
ncbi:hypothetical protein TNCV_3743961 [Trichonephila clavipes]|nr:hypothetical protein TNCV_3743961 [Trichonephila clavipes]